MTVKYSKTDLTRPDLTYLATLPVTPSFAKRLRLHPDYFRCRMCGCWLTWCILAPSKRRCSHERCAPLSGHRVWLHPECRRFFAIAAEEGGDRQ